MKNGSGCLSTCQFDPRRLVRLVATATRVVDQVVAMLPSSSAECDSIYSHLDQSLINWVY